MTGSRSFLELLPPLLVFCQVFNHGLILEEETEPNYLTAAVGEYVVFNCDLDFPHETPIPYILQWNRDVSV
ncbi:protein borderless isoform X2 [Vespula maculifrons]|uniref:Protein borderless isoform X2 n=1 Tax=Vespula maculifrons TaxID=7453 RepID=A0ABD2BIL5_VESMC